MELVIQFYLSVKKIKIKIKTIIEQHDDSIILK